jgi:hypothetical protein
MMATRNRRCSPSSSSRTRSGDIADGRAGAFTTEAEALVISDRLMAEGHHGSIRINMVPVQARAADWEFDL